MNLEGEKNFAKQMCLKQLVDKERKLADKAEKLDVNKHLHTYIHNWPLQPFSQDY